MFQLYKSRDFGLYFQDTFDFLKIHGKHFFKNYIRVNGIFLLILIVMSIVFAADSNDVFADEYIQIDNFGSLTNYFTNKTAIAIALSMLYSILIFFITVLTYAYVPIYFKLYERHKGENFESKQILEELSANISKLIIFVFATILISIPTFIFAYILAFLMAITIIGIILVPFLMGLLFFFYHTAFIEYIKSDNKGVFECFNYGFNSCFQKFFSVAGATGIFLLIIMIFQFVLGYLQILFIESFYLVGNPYDFSELGQWSFSYIILLILQIVTFIVAAILTTAFQTNLSIIYYGLKEENENINTQSTIDQIGSAKG